MKHIFFVHSHITYLVSLSVIKHESIDKSNCIFLMDRGYKKNNSDIVCYDFPFQTYPEYFILHFFFWKGLKKLANLDNFISKICREKFIIYFPETEYGFFGLIISNKNCEGFNIIEEGLAAYWEKSIFDKEHPVNKINKGQKILAFFNYLGRISTHICFFDDRYQKIYCISNFAFRGYERRVVLSLSYGIASNSVVDAFSRANILVFDAVVEYSVVKLEIFLSALDVFLNTLSSNGVSSMYFKFHPQQYVNTECSKHIRNIFDSFNTLIDFKEIPSDLCLEEIAIQAKPNFYINVSSVGLYACFFGCTVYSYAEFIADNEPTYREKIQKLPDIFHKKIKFLNPR